MWNLGQDLGLNMKGEAEIWLISPRKVENFMRVQKRGFESV